MSNTRTTINRTLILGLGDSAMDVIEAFHTRLDERRSGSEAGHDELPIATLALSFDSGDTGIVPIICAGRHSRRESTGARKHGSGDELHGKTTFSPLHPRTSAPPHGYWSALDDHIDHVTASITQALAGISQIPLDLGSGNNLSSAQIDVYLVVALDEPLAGILIDVAYLVRQLVGRRLNARAHLSGLLLLPDVLALDDPEPALARTYAALKTIDAYMKAHDGYRRPYASGTVIDGWGPVFDGDPFLVGALTCDGLHLSQRKAREHLVAEMLIQLTTSGVGRAALAGDPLVCQIDSRPSYSSLGIASLVYPGHMVREFLARRLAHQILGAWISDLPGEIDASQAIAFLADHGFDPGSIRERVLPGDVVAQAGIGHPIRVDRSWGQLHTLRDAVDETVAGRLEVLNAHRKHLEDSVEALADELSHVLGEHLAERVDRPEPSGLWQILALVRRLKSHLLALRKRETEHADERWEAFQKLSDEVDRVGSRLAGDSTQVAALRPTTPRAALGLLLKPHRWLEIWHTWRAVQQTKMTYVALLQRQVELTVDILRSDLEALYFQVAAARVEHHEHRLEALIGAVEAAVRELDDRDVEENSPLHLRTSAAPHDLEWSVLTPRQARHLYEETVDDLTAELSGFAGARKPLSTWLAHPPEAADIKDAVLEFTRHRLHPVLDVTVGQLLAARYPDPDRRYERLEALLDAAVPFLAWDETAMRAGDGEAVQWTEILGVPAADSELIGPDVESLRRSSSLVSTADRYRIVALTLIKGVPMAAIPIAHEAAVCYAQAPEPRKLHGDPTAADLPDVIQEA